MTERKMVSFVNSELNLSQQQKEPEQLLHIIFI